MVKHRTLSIFLTVFFLVIMTASAYALPTLTTNAPNKMKFTNYENVYDLDGNIVGAGETIQEGFTFAGIFTVTTIADVQTNGITWANLGLGGETEELTGYFQYTVSKVDVTGDDLRIDFIMNDDDFMKFYFDDTNYDFNADAAVIDKTDIEEIADKTGVKNGDLYFSITGGDYLAGYTTQDLDPPGQSLFTFNWMNLSENYTGYEIAPMLWPDTSGSSTGGKPDLVSDLYLESKINVLDGSPNFGFRSEDPLYLYATPEPATFVMLGLGLLGFAGVIRRKVVK